MEKEAGSPPQAKEKKDESSIVSLHAGFQTSKPKD